VAVTVAETILVFVGVPLAIVLLIALVTLGPAARNRRPRYKPGQPWNHESIWYEPHPGATGHGGDHADGETTAIGSSVYGERQGLDGDATHAVSGGSTSVGGSSSVGGSAARAPRPAGPLGGARGTW
jgi:hypothetical protein